MLESLLARCGLLPSAEQREVTVSDLLNSPSSSRFSSSLKHQQRGGADNHKQRNGGRGKARTPPTPRQSRGRPRSGLALPSRRCRRGGARPGCGVHGDPFPLGQVRGSVHSCGAIYVVPGSKAPRLADASGLLYLCGNLREGDGCSYRDLENGGSGGGRRSKNLPMMWE